MFNITIFILAINLAFHEAAVIRLSGKNENTTSNTSESTNIPPTTLEYMLTTRKDQDLMDLVTEKSGALTRDEEAILLIVEQTLSDTEPAELIKTDAVDIIENKKSEKLLLLSTPKITEKSKQPEEDLAESEEKTELSKNVTESTEETSTTSIEEVTISNVNNEASTEKSFDIEDQRNWTAAKKITKLFPISETISANTSKQSIFNLKKILVNGNSSYSITEQENKDSINVNYGSFILEESEADYVLVDAKFLQGSYIDVGSELHFQPIVQSVEVVPSSLDDFIFLYYVQS